MVAHRTIMYNMGVAVRDSSAVCNYCVDAFALGLSVHVGAYPDGIPGKADSPFLWLFADADTENEDLKADRSFTVHGIVGACVVGEGGERKIVSTVTERTSTANGLTVNGGNATVEELRDMILDVIRAARVGAIPTAIRRKENDVSHFPLEWAEFEVDFLEPEALNN